MDVNSNDQLPLPPLQLCKNYLSKLLSLGLQSRVNDYYLSLQFSSVAQSCPTLCDPMNCSMPGLPVHHQLLELPKLMCIESVMPSNRLILSRPLLLPSIFPSIRVFSNESALGTEPTGGQSIGASGSVHPMNIQG